MEIKQLADDVKNYYLTHFDELGGYGFHFASRLYLWCQDEESKLKLDEKRKIYTHESAFQDQINFAVTQLRKKSIVFKNANLLRKEYLDIWLRIKEINAVLYEILFAKTIFASDYVDKFYEYFRVREIEDLIKQIYTTPRMLAVLSTQAINLIYLYNKLILEKHEIDQLVFLKIAKAGYNLSEKVEIQLMIYLLTHSIIGETMFYYFPVRPSSTAMSIDMISTLERIIEKRYIDISLDSKCEFLVCARILGYESKLESKIYTEVSTSLSNEGTFIVDRHNNSLGKSKNFAKSEHRNVLFIMSAHAFHPIHDL